MQSGMQSATDVGLEPFGPPLLISSDPMPFFLESVPAAREQKFHCLVRFSTALNLAI